MNKYHMACWADYPLEGSSYLLIATSIRETIQQKKGQSPSIYETSWSLKALQAPQIVHQLRL